MFHPSSIHSRMCVFITLALVPCTLQVSALDRSDEPVDNIANTTAPLERVKRLISFPINGGVAKIVLGFLAPVRFHHPLPRSLNCGINVQANYVISPDIIFPRPESIFGNRKLDQYADPESRQRLYGALEKILKMLLGTHRRARDCLLRVVCEVADTPLHHNGLVGELLDVIFTPQESDALPPEFLMAHRYGANGVNCLKLYSACSWGMGLLDYVSRIGLEDLIL
uniref:Secreted protein n=1 Tax=Anopheles culicifacies TaxID=139723 RepID=A0A182MHF9_9DIPT